MIRSLCGLAVGYHAIGGLPTLVAFTVAAAAALIGFAWEAQA